MVSTHSGMDEWMKAMLPTIGQAGLTGPGMLKPMFSGGRTKPYALIQVHLEEMGVLKPAAAPLRVFIDQPIH
jgi:hypothetical protein